MADASDQVTSTRTRTIPSPGRVGRLVVVWESTHPSDRPSRVETVTEGTLRAAAYHGKQVTVSENHPLWNRHRGSSADLGGPFYTQKTSVSANMADQSIMRVKQIDQWRRQTSVYTGPVLAVNENNLTVASNNTFGFPTTKESNNSTLDAWGTKAIAAVKPTNSLVDLSVLLGELTREGLPNLMGLSLKRPDSPPKKVGGEYLNLEFGWKPLIRDSQAFAKVVADTDAAIQQYIRDSGRIVRRRFNFPSETSETNVQLGPGPARVAASNSDIVVSTAARVWRTDRIVRHRWFSGAFTYHLPEFDEFGSMARDAAVARKLYGASIDPDTLWNLAPWSWAVDWFGSVGDALSNVTDMATDGLVMRWGYLMEHTVHTRTFNLVGHSGYYGNPQASSVTVSIETKVRRRANPFGFGLLMSGLSPRQQAILAALGISRGR